MHAYSVIRNEWRRLGDMPDRRDSHGAVFMHGKLILCGGGLDINLVAHKSCISLEVVL
jgi:hypothetical protein